MGNFRQDRAIDNTSVTIGIGATVTKDVEVAGFDRLTVIADIGPAAGAAGDVGLTVQPYDAKGVLFTLALAAATTVAPALTTGHAQTIQTFDVRGIEKVQVQLKNNNAAAKNGFADVFASQG